jgi:hypothetical protein
MPFLSSFLSRTCRSLSGHLGRLGRSFEDLAGQVREAIARSIGRTVAEAVQAALAESPAAPDLPPRPPRGEASTASVARERPPRGEASTASVAREGGRHRSPEECVSCELCVSRNGSRCAGAGLKPQGKQSMQPTRPEQYGIIAPRCQRGVLGNPPAAGTTEPK